MSYEMTFRIIIIMMIFCFSAYANDEILSAGVFHTCAIDKRSDSMSEAGSVKCWGGKNQNGEASPPKGNFIQVSSGHSFSCGLRENLSITCWGSIEPKDHKEDKFRQISSGNFHACALTKSGEIKCWGKNDSRESDAPKGQFIQVTSGLHHTCALRRNGSVECWGKNELGQSQPPNIAFRQISAGFKSHVCGVELKDSNVVCWGDNSHGQSQSREGPFVQVATGYRSTCAIRKDPNSLECWGRYPKGKKFGSGDILGNVSIGQDHACAVTVKGEVECWGSIISTGHAIPTDFRRRNNDDSL